MELRVLLVEDDDDDYALISELVAEIQDPLVTLVRRQSYQSALSCLLDADIQACLVDFQIGETSGVDFVRKLKAIGCNVPMIILTGSNDKNIDFQALAAGAANFLDKNSLDSEHLGRTLRYASRDQRSPQEQPGSGTLIEAGALPSLNEKRQVGTDTLHILLIEDDEDDYYLTREILVDVFGRSLDLTWIRTWQDGLERVLESRHDVVVVDYRLGEKNGLELVREAVHLGCNMPFIVLTGEGNREIDLEAMHAGATDYLVKGEISGPLLDRSIRYAIERRRSERHLLELARIDQLTGLANRYRFREFLDQSIARAGRRPIRFALMLIDLNRFKAVNDTYGHAAGDLLLQEIAGRLRRCVRPCDLVARLGGDEFTVVMNDLESLTNLDHLADRLLEEIRQPIDIGPCKVEVGACIGIALYPDNAETADAIIVNADMAMYAGKSLQAGSVHFYTSEMHRDAIMRLELERGLRAAIDREEFELYFQPQVDLKSGQLLGFEALLRWHHPDLGLITPGDFIELAEESGLVLPISEWVLRTACQQLAAWRDDGLPDVHIAINFSARQFEEPRLVELVAETLQHHQLSPRLLEIEITESDILQNPAEAHKLLSSFAEFGIRVALDDFGTGYSSLNHLRAFPGAIIKIDRSFIRDIEMMSSNRAIVQSLISMAHDLDLLVVAEGVEKLEQLQYLRDHDCDIIQGYLISKPISASDIQPPLFQENLLADKAQSLSHVTNTAD